MATAVEIPATTGDLAGLVRSWHRHMRAENKAEKTIGTYLSACKLLIDFLHDSGIPTDVGKLTLEHLELFQQRELERTSASSALVRHRAIKTFFRWAEDEGELVDNGNPANKWKAPKVGIKAVPVLREADMVALLKACGGTDFESRRDNALLRFAMTTGVRRNELATLRWSEDPDRSDLNLDVNVARVTGKGNKERLVTIDAKTARSLDRYIRLRDRHKLADMPWLWLSRKGRLTDDGIRQMLERRAAKAGIGHVHLHQLRHSYAHYFLRDGGGEVDLQRLMGWNSHQMVARYAASAGVERALLAAKTKGPGQFL